MKNLRLQIVALVGVALSFMASHAMAALDAGIATGLDLVETDGLALQGLVWPVVITITAGFVMFKIFKRGAAKI